MNKDFAQAFKQIKQGLSFLKDNSSLNGVPISLAVKTKFVWDGEDGYIYRIDDPFSAIQRILLYKYFEEKGIAEVLLKEEVLPEYFSPEDGFLITRQKKIEIAFKSEEEIISLIKNSLSSAAFDTFSEVQKELSFLGFGDQNTGLAEGKVKIFDYVANVAVTERDGAYKLVNKKGDILCEGRF